MPKIRLPAPDILLIIICVLGLAAYYLQIGLSDQVEFILAVVGFAGLVPVFIGGGRALLEGRVTVDMLASVALIFSLVNHEWPSAVFINLMLASARLFSARTHDSVHQALRDLVKLRPQKARIQRSGNIMSVNVSEVRVGDIVIVELGERVPVDGTVVGGEAAVDQSSFTGESLPVNRKSGDKVLGSTVIVDGSISVKAEKIGADSAFEHIVRLMESAQNNKARITGIADKFAAVYIIGILIVAVAIYLATKNLDLVLSVLLVVCADDIAVAIPLSMTAAISYAARHGVIIKGSSYLEALAGVKTMIMDKTGTLTQGRLRVAGFQMLGHGFDQEGMLALAAGMAGYSTHPVSVAVADYVKALKIEKLDVEGYEEVSGQGLLANYNRKHGFLGRASYLDKLGIEVTSHQLQEINKFADMGYNVTVLSYAKKLVGMFTIRDEIKPEAAQAIAALKNQDVNEIVMLTGDNEKVAAQIADRSGITSFKANLLPQDKLMYLKTRIGRQKKLAMIGDGVNDAPALALAPVGIAMGAIGSDVAVESADIVLMKDNLMQIVQTSTLAKEVMKIAKQNFGIWAISNAVGLTLVFAGVLTPASAAAFNFLTDFIPIINALRVLKLKSYESPDPKSSRKK